MSFVSYLILHAFTIYIHKFINRIFVLMQFLIFFKLLQGLANVYSNVDSMVSTDKQEQEGYFMIHLIQSLLLIALTCLGFLLTIFVCYRTLYIDIKDGQLSLTFAGIVSLLLVSFWVFLTKS